jgi:predicted DNA binding CopG/RHH family protein
MNRLDADEREILAAFESGKLKPVKNRSRELARHRKVAEGLPYQTLVSSVLHKFVEGQMVEQPAGKGLQRPR